MSREELNYPIIERLKAIREALLSGEPFTATTIARDLQCSTKTIQRDIDFLRDRCGYVIEFDCQHCTWTGRAPAEPIL